MEVSLLEIALVLEEMNDGYYYAIKAGGK